MGAMDALESAERALRSLILEVIGQSWLGASGAPPEENLVGDQRREAARRPSVQVSQNLIDYTYTGALRNIIVNNREAFVEVFPNFDRMCVFLDYVVSIRNSIGHARPLYAHERSLLEGISGEIRNSLSIYRMNQQDLTRHYGTLIGVSDNFGFEGYADMTDADAFSSPRPVLEVGDTVTFDCEGWDGRGRDVEWCLFNWRTQEPSEWTPECVGDNVSLAWTVTDRDVGLKRILVVAMRSSGRFHLRDRTLPFPIDGERWFVYHVNPPVD